MFPIWCIAVFSTKKRRNLIATEMQPELWAFVGGIARKNGFKALIVGGTENHVHLLLSLPATMPLAKAMQLVKGASSRWMNEKHGRGFAWQEGYGAFTVGISQKDHTIEYIRTQAEHHRKRSFEEEFVAFLKKHGVEYDPQYVWGYCATGWAMRRFVVTIQASLRDAVLFCGTATRRWKRRAIVRRPPGPAAVAQRA